MTDHNQMNLKQLKQGGREMGLLRVDRNDKKELRDLKKVNNRVIIIKMFY